MRKMRLFTAAAAATFLLASFLTGCGGTDDIKSAGEPLTASQAFGQESVWVQYNKNDAIEKDEEIQRVLVFDNAGNVTAYQCSGATFGDLNGMSDEQIIELAREQDKSLFDTQRQDALDSTSKAIERMQSYYDALKAEYENGTYTSALRGSALSDLSDEDIQQVKDTYSQVLSDLESTLNTATEGQASTESSSYQEPQAVPYTLHIETDGSGNNTKIESVSFQAPSYSFFKASVDDEEQELSDVFLWGVNGSVKPAGDGTADQTIELYPVNKQTVYDMTFRGFSGLATIVNEDHAGFTLDTPDTEGIEVD